MVSQVEPVWSFVLKIGHFLVEGRYYYALSDFYSSTKKDYFSRSAHGVITAKITYLFDLKK